MPLDLQFVRSQFPALGNDWAFFDNAGGSQVLKTVADRISDYLLTTNVQIGASYLISQKASERLAEARSRVALLVNAAMPQEIVFGPSTTILMRFLAIAMASQLSVGDEIILTNFDHESNIGPWLTLKDRGVVFKFWQIDPDSLVPNLEKLGQLMTKKTRLVCVTHASNILGTINPIRQIADFVHERGARICVDGVALAPHRAIDVKAFDADYYLFSFYKTYGPHFAMLYGRHDHLLELDGLYHYFYGKDKVPGKLEPGNPNYELAWGTAGIVDYFEKLGGGSGRGAICAAFDKIAKHESLIGESLLDWLRQRNGVRILGSDSSEESVRVPTISFTIDNYNAGDVVKNIDKSKIGIRHGDFHSRRLIEAVGLSPGGVIRVSMVHYNTLDEVDRLKSALKQALQ